MHAERCGTLRRHVTTELPDQLRSAAWQQNRGVAKGGHLPYHQICQLSTHQQLSGLAIMLFPRLARLMHGSILNYLLYENMYCTHGRPNSNLDQKWHYKTLSISLNKFILEFPLLNNRLLGLWVPNSFNVEGMITMPVFSLTGASWGRKTVQLLDGRKLCTVLYEGLQSKDKESREKAFKQVISRAAVHHVCPEPW